ncbi:MAG: hypothetical protein H0T89_10430 [Deltaproteobacteria bacterium]|nr:hypothetical protein [Deltaproteobacteria bacterium]MDQ3296262.1 hypothetical protein [Myxococcota bacterium]
MTELGTLVRGDHDDLTHALRVLADPMASAGQLSATLDHLVVTFPAHAEAECLTLHAMLEAVQPPPAVYFLIAQVVAAHLAQESALIALTRLQPGTPRFRDSAVLLGSLIQQHADHELACLQPALVDHVPRTMHEQLAHSYTSERARSLELAEEAARFAQHHARRRSA